jgi:hypothetical protein
MAFSLDQNAGVNKVGCFTISSVLDNPTMTPQLKWNGMAGQEPRCARPD